MKISKNSSGLIIGAIFTLGSLLLTATFIVPIISVLPGMLFEKIAESCINNDPYSNVGKLTILLLTVTFFLTLILCLLSIKNKTGRNEEISNGRIIAIFSLIYFIVHSLGFYIYWGVSLDFRSDGQLIFGAVISYPISSFVFIFIGLLIDLVKNRNSLSRPEIG
jgi:DMSO/TMAO reductase YedYZ heme-binding membrane subunit